MDLTRAVRITCTGVTNGFRSPLSQTVHDTLPLPTPTHLIGLIAAAAGIGRREIEPLYYSFKVGVVGTHSASYQDLTRIVKYKGNKQFSSLLVRENLFNTHFKIWYVPTGKLGIDYILNAFRNPKYALSLGRDDEIIRVDDISDVELEDAGDAILRNTVVPFSLDPKKDRIADESNFMAPLVSVPLPRAFTVDHKLRRTPVDFTSYTFIERYSISTTRSGAYNDKGEYFFAL